jgi:hypothetical protein
MMIGLATCSNSPAAAQPLTLEHQQTVTRTIPGATAAFSLDPLCASAAAKDGTITIVGRAPGSTHVIVIIGDRSEAILVIVRELATSVRLADAASAANPDEEASYETRFGSDPAILQNGMRLWRRYGTRTTELSLGSAVLLRSREGSVLSVPLAAYTVRTPGREITLLDKLVANSPLTVSRSNIRGVHLREGRW